MCLLLKRKLFIYICLCLRVCVCVYRYSYIPPIGFISLENPNAESNVVLAHMTM